jgi:hypothetical protein
MTPFAPPSPAKSLAKSPAQDLAQSPAKQQLQSPSVPLAQAAAQQAEQDAVRPPKQLFLAWVAFQRRAVTMQSYFGYDLHHINLSFKRKWLRPFEYLVKAWQSLALMLRDRPEILWVQMPPAPLLYLVFAYKTLFHPQVKLVADCHNATFRAPWINFPGCIALLNRCDLVIVHNDNVAQQARELGIRADRTQVLLDRIQALDPGAGFAELAQQLGLEAPWFLIPCSFNADEPIATILEAAGQAPDLTFVLTGNPARAKGHHDLSDRPSHIPSNIKLPGFLPEAQFNALLYNANAVVGLTKLDGIQLSVASEALGCDRPMVLANTSLLQRLFPQGAIYVDPMDAQDLVAGCRQAQGDSDRLTAEVIALKGDRAQQWLAAAAPLRNALFESRPGNP